MIYSLEQLEKFPIKEMVDDHQHYVFYYLDKSWEEDKNYHMYFYYEDGTYDICDYVDGINELSKEDYLLKMKEELIETIIHSVLMEIFQIHVSLYENDASFFEFTKTLINSDIVTELDKTILKDFFIAAVKNFIKSEIDDLKIKELYKEINEINKVYKKRNISKSINEMLEIQENLLRSL